MPAIDLHTTPGMEPPPGVTAHPLDRSPVPVSLTIVATICLFLTTTAISARMFTKAYDLRNVQLEDYAIIFAGLGFIAWTGVLFDGTISGQGHHLWNVSKFGESRTAVMSNILAILYTPVMYSAKLAVLLQISRIFAPPGAQRNLIFYSVRVLITLNSLTYLAIFFARVFACVPRAKIGNPQVKGHCISQSGSIVATGVINLVSDISILLLPLYGVWGLKLAIRKKLAIGAVFGTGLFACTASLVRLVYSVKLDNDPDFTMGIWPVDLWALAEFTSVILVACFPTFPRLLKYLQGRVQKHRSRYGSAGSQWPSHPSFQAIRTPNSSNPSEKKKQSSESEGMAMSDRTPSPSSSKTAVDEAGKDVSRLKKPKPAKSRERKLSFTSIRKTVEVRLSNHTGPKTPDALNQCTPFDGA